MVAAKDCNRGHAPARTAYIAGTRSGWKCSICRCTASTKLNLTKHECGGRKEWEQRKPKSATTPLIHDGHARVYSGEVLWCSICGAYADSKAKGMAQPCDGLPEKRKDCGGMWGQRLKLQRRCRPKTFGLMLVHRNADGTLWQPSGGTYANLGSRKTASEQASRRNNDSH